jgi:lipid-binding SYLF domain-containing protein
LAPSAARRGLCIVLGVNFNPPSEVGCYDSGLRLGTGLFFLREDENVKKTLCIVALGLVATLPLFAQKKVDDRLEKSTTAMQAILQGDKGLPTSILNRAQCVLIFPSVKKVAIGIGGSYGRGELVCRKGSDMNGSWGAPAMYALDQGSLGVQLGSTATDFVLVVMSHQGVEQILNGKTKLGGNAAAAAGPTGAQATGYNADAMKVDVLTYSRSKGLFAGVSLEGASMDADHDANKSLYGKEISAHEIISGAVPAPASAQSLISLLDNASPSRK